MLFLEQENQHERDSHITFDEEPHIYTIDGDSDYMSVTTWNHSHFSPFDADTVITNMMNSPKWPNNKYYGKTADEIKTLWENNRKEASVAGTKLHLDIEYYYNKLPVNNDSIEYKYFMNFLRDFPHLKPYRTEWMIWDKELRFAGSIDMVFENPDGTLLIYDWKRSKGIDKSTRYMKFSHTECISHIPDTNFWHYCLQLNTYKAILEKNYGKTISGMALVCLHPNKNNYQLIPVLNLQTEVQALFNLRKNMLLMT